MPLFQIHHVTRYEYQDQVRDSANQIVLYPIEDQHQEILSHELLITGKPNIEVFKDYYGNQVGSFTYQAAHKELVIDSKLVVKVSSKALPDDSTDKDLQWAHILEIANKVPYIDFIQQEYFPSIEELKQINPLKESRLFTPLHTAKQLSEYVFTHFAYNKGVTDVETTLETVWELKAGVCQDFAHMLLAMLHLVGIPARYVSGYICPNKNGMRGEGATHAWVEAYIPFYGWLGLDPTNNCVVNDLHVRLAVGRNFNEVSPVKGTYKGTSQHELMVGVTVSYEGDKPEEAMPQPIMSAQTKSESHTESKNSYRLFLEMQQQQQQ